MGMRHGYLRYSTHEQRPDRQIAGLRAECDRLHIERAVSAVAKKRPVFERLLTQLREGDTLVVWDLDRAFRSAIHALTVAESLRRRGVHFRIVSLSIDTSTAEGAFFYTVAAGAAQFERDILSRRTKEGLVAARQNGKSLGRPRKLSPAKVERARQLLAADPARTITGLARSLRCSRKTLSRALKSASAQRRHRGGEAA